MKHALAGAVLALALVVSATTAAEPGNGAKGREAGTFVASGPQGTVTLNFKSIRPAPAAR
jgi:hypothetical protein